MKQETSIDTERLFITPLTAEDNTFIFELVNTEGWLKFIGNRNVYTTEDASAYIERIKSNKNIQYWIARLKQNKTAIGIITLIKRDHLEHPDIGFAFLPQFSNNGFAYEATKAVLNFILQRHNYEKIAAITIPGNKRSIGLLRKLDFHLEKKIVDNNEELELYSVPTSDLKKMLNNSNR